MQPDPAKLIEKIGISAPLIGFYDAPDAGVFHPLVSPKPGNKACVFMFYKNWQKGETLHITKDNFGCGGAGSYLFSVDVRTREDLIDFLVDGEGLKASQEIMARWVEQRRTYRPEHPNIFIGPLRDGQYEYLRSIIFFVNPDQLSALMIGAQYNSAPGDPPPVIAPFGSGCSLMLPPFDDPNIPQAVIGATDIAMRQFLPPDILALTVTKPMFKQLCELDEKSFLYKPFWKNLMRAREHSRKAQV